MRANKFFLVWRLLTKGLLFKTCLILILSTSASLASICSLVHGNCEDGYSVNGTSRPAYVGSDVSKFVGDKQDGIAGCAGFSDKGAAPHTANSSPWPAYARKNDANNAVQYVCSACIKDGKVVVDLQGYARWNCYRKCDETNDNKAELVAEYTVQAYANRPYRDRFVRSQAQCNEKYGKIAGSDEWPTKYIEITKNVCGKCKPVEELTDDEKCEDGMALSSYPTDSPCYYPCKKSYTLKDGTQCCADSSWEKMPDGYSSEYKQSTGGKCYNTKTERAANGHDCYKQTEVKVKSETSASAPMFFPFPSTICFDDDELDCYTPSQSTVSETEEDEDEVICTGGKVWSTEKCDCVFTCEGNMFLGGEDGVTCTSCPLGMSANYDHTSCGCMGFTTEGYDCPCNNNGGEWVDGNCRCPAGKYFYHDPNYPNYGWFCKECEGNTYTDAPNFDETGGSCTPCPEGMVANSDHTGCECPTGMVENDEGECVCKIDGAEIVDGVCKCPAGTFVRTILGPAPRPGAARVQRDVCTQCSGDKYTDEPNLSSSCTVCPEGTVANEDHTGCVCENGGELKDGVCVCPEGTSVIDGKCVCDNGSDLIDGVCECAINEKKVDGVCKNDECRISDGRGGYSPIGYKITNEQVEQCSAEGGNVGYKVYNTEAGTGCYAVSECVFCEDGEKFVVNKCVNDKCSNPEAARGRAIGYKLTEEQLARCRAVAPGGYVAIMYQTLAGSNCYRGWEYCACPEGAVSSVVNEALECSCPDDTTLSDDGSKCVCDNGGELQDGKCVCVDGKVLYNGQCTDPCGSNTRTAKACSEDDNSKVGNTCNYCYSAGTAGIPGSSATMQCYERGTETCEEGYEYNIDSETCAAQGKYILYSTKSFRSCGPCAKCVDEDPCVTKKGEGWSSEPCTSATEGYTKSEEDDKCYYCNNNSMITITFGNGCYHHEVFDMGPTEAECAARGAIRKRGSDINSPCGPDYVCECPDGAEFDNNNQCACKNGGRLSDGKCVAGGGCTSNAGCENGKVCVNGECVAGGGCTSNAECETGKACVNGECVAGKMCVESADCNGGKVCKNNICIDNPCVEPKVWDDSDGTCVVRVEDTCSESEYPYVKEGDYSNSKQCSSIYAESFTACIIYTKNTGKIKECTSNGVTRFGCADGYVLDGTNCIDDEQSSGLCKRINSLYLDTCEPKCSNGYLTTCKEIEGTTCYMALSSPCTECNEKEGTCSHKTCAEMGYMEPKDCTESCAAGQAVSCTSVSPGYGLKCVENTIKACLLCNGNKCLH